MPLKKYDWDKWLRRNEFVLTQGKDFEVAPQIMSLQLREQAGKRGYRVSIRVSPESLFVRITKRPKVSTMKGKK